MRIFFATAVLLISIPASSQQKKKAVMQRSDATQATSMLGDIHAVSPALERYSRDRLLANCASDPICQRGIEAS